VEHEALRASDDLRLLDRLRAGDEASFARLVREHSPALLRLAQSYVRSRAVAEEVVQEAWLGVIRGLDRFEGRSSLKTWIFRIAANCAKTRAERESRTVPFSALEAASALDEPAVEPERFLDAAHPRWPGHWTAFPSAWDGVPEARLVSEETRAVIEAAIEALPPAQRQVVSLRDVEGWSSEDVCALLGLYEVNQRVILHRARAKVRAGLERYLEGEDWVRT
jgi:RNA polymerase sigma-70 factor (ECF subfamily)